MSKCVEPHPDSHRFVIPVEWEYMSGFKGTWKTGSNSPAAPIAKRVTKLRCECGEEASR